MRFYREYKNTQIDRRGKDSKIIICKVWNIMDIKKLAVGYEIRELNKNDLDLIFNLSVGNHMFYEYCPPYVTKESIQNDMNALPPGKRKEDKFYVGYFDQEQLVAIMDFIIKYPDEETVYIGLFMMEQKYQGKGIGSKIINEFSEYVNQLGFQHIQLAFAKGNSQSESFWLKNNFVKTGKESENEGYIAVCMKRDL